MSQREGDIDDEVLGLENWTVNTNEDHQTSSADLIQLLLERKSILFYF